MTHNINEAERVSQQGIDAHNWHAAGRALIAHAIADRLMPVSGVFVTVAHVPSPPYGGEVVDLSGTKAEDLLIETHRVIGVHPERGYAWLDSMGLVTHHDDVFAGVYVWSEVPGADAEKRLTHAEEMATAAALNFARRLKRVGGSL